jgi:hypothetical protein
MIADDLRRQADNFIELDDLRDVVGRPPREPRGAGGEPRDVRAERTSERASERPDGGPERTSERTPERLRPELRLTPREPEPLSPAEE